MVAINKTQWKIVKELSKGNRTQSELAKTFKMSLPSIHMQLKSLEREKLVKKVGEIKGKTRPYAEYSIGNGFIYFMKVLPNEAEQTFLEIDENIKLHLRIWSIPQREYQFYVEKFWWGLQDYLGDIDAVIIYGSVAQGEARQGSDIDILLLVNKGVKKYEKMFGAKMVGQRGKRKMISCQIFETNDFKNSLEKGSDFAREIINNNLIIYDNSNSFTKLKNES